MRPGQQLGGSCIQRGAGGAADGANQGQRRWRAGECSSSRLAQYHATSRWDTSECLPGFPATHMHQIGHNFAALALSLSTPL